MDKRERKKSKRGESKSESHLRKIERDYFKELDWEVKENANEIKSFGNFLSYFLDKHLKKPEVLKQIFPAEAVKHHVSGCIHIHKLPYSLYIPYCVGWSFSKLLQLGLRTPTLISKPAKHLDTAVAQLVNFFFIVAQEWSGAMATSAFDLNCAAFVAKDKLKEKQVKQALQDMLFELNYPSRMGYQTPFTNLTILLDTVKSFLEMPAVVGGEIVGRFEDYVDEAIMVVEKLIELYNEGDRVATPFTFPIPTLMLTRNFDWNSRRWGELTDMIFENLAKRGTFYLLNGYATDVETLYSMCCRLVIDTSKLARKSAHGIWAIPDATGSIGVVTINLPRLAYLSNGKWERFEELLKRELQLARNVLKVMRERYERSLRIGLMPMTKLYLGSFGNHFSTFGLLGLPEAAANFLGIPDMWERCKNSEIRSAVRWMKKVVAFVRNYAENCMKEDKILYNVEEVPGESTSYKFARLDMKRFKSAVKRNELCMPREGDVAFYSNSIIPYYANVSIVERAKWEGEVQTEFTGGVMMHLFLYEEPEPGALKRLVRKIATNTKVVYFSITPTISQCRHCGWSSVGIVEKCPKCGRKTQIWSRIVGYYRPVQNWNIGKKLEFALREQYGTSEVRKVLKVKF